MSQSRCHYTTTGDYICSKNRSIQGFSNAKCSDEGVFPRNHKQFNMNKLRGYRKCTNECLTKKEIFKLPPNYRRGECLACCPSIPGNLKQGTVQYNES
jgi:hypothetical protein